MKLAAQHGSRIKTSILGAMVAALVGGSLAAPAAAASDDYQRGPAPTQSSIEARKGTFDIEEENVRSLGADGFGGGTIYYPKDTSQGTFGAIAVSPGFVSPEALMSWYGPRLASQGFVVITIGTNTLVDQPASRGRQLLAALDYLLKDASSDVKSRIDPTRMATIGHSMGGGGVLEAQKDRPSLKAGVALTPWNLTKNWSRNTVPTLVVGAENDLIAPTRSHAKKFYDSLGADKAYLELNGASHLAPNSTDDTIGAYTLAWLKVYVDNDTRYSQFLNPGPGKDRKVSEYKTSGL